MGFRSRSVTGMSVREAGQVKPRSLTSFPVSHSDCAHSDLLRRVNYPPRQGKAQSLFLYRGGEETTSNIPPGLYLASSEAGFVNNAGKT